MAPDPHQGGRLEDMAEKGTSIPGDAGVQRTIPSVARPDQANPPPQDFSHPNPAHAADNAFDIPRGPADRGTTGEIMTGTGDQMPSNIEKKSFDDAPMDPRAKGSDQYYKHAKQRNDFARATEADHGVRPAPGEEDMSQEDLLNKRGAQ
ncbi:hypothetical protein BU26DRAFT_550682 [Trematosphaeria pertusa]|uniref:Uncharacterized protein n=1 Tax=Trematosphaeria pertusa TaxID=390896 RepID=A0A6A6IE94_9PLEO|nr:uncharacterized protein BU26DRAFT_550682 [Trematosphaeria pertusa]KAF2248746.1 hypothetical protein BU26DRAFT_550682 [Trematosphaeria pertusa]